MMGRFSTSSLSRICGRCMEEEEEEEEEEGLSTCHLAP